VSLLERYVERVGIEFDTAVNVLFGGALNETVSMRAAVAQKDGERWGCWLCWLLGKIVQPHHCRDQFLSAPAPALVYLRAGVAFAVAGFGLYQLARASVWAVQHVLPSI
jgi:hypothetical protein